jgi:hypothetical protein
MVRVNKKISIETAFSGHKRCFICRRKRGPLRRVSKESIATAFSKFNIFIPEGTRSCHQHIDADLNIFELEFLNENIPTHSVEYDYNLTKAFEALTKQNEKREVEIKCLNENMFIGPFEAFKNIETLDDDHCFKITGFTKKEFEDFSKYIKNIKKSNNRTEGELIALYMYWARKALDQESLSYFKRSSSQPQISNELKQIRKSIYKNFTPKFIGFKNKYREFFTSHNTPSVKKLYDVDENTICLLIDGGYQRIEHGQNNDFQSNTYSGQYGENLIKPLLIVTPDGYICDVYCDHEAWKNDEKILRQTLASDRCFRKILRENDLIFVDRGKRYFKNPHIKDLGIYLSQGTNLL